MTPTTAMFTLRELVLYRRDGKAETACPQDAFDRTVARILNRAPGSEFTTSDVTGDDGPEAAEVAIAFLADREIITPVPNAPGGGAYRAGPDLQADAIAAFWALDGADAGTDPLLDAAERLLRARQDDMLTVEEWTALARAVAARTGRRTADLLTPRDLEEVAGDPPLPWDEAVDGPLPEM
ncbi:MAG: hypothetical protein IT436_12080 [Phycisphaerales bacterium]|nr:hypothetical protein [Phycisphaerales bacterium]